MVFIRRQSFVPIPGETLAESSSSEHGRASTRRDAMIVLIVAGAIGGFYALFKAVSVLAGLPFP